MRLPLLLARLLFVAVPAARPRRDYAVFFPATSCVDGWIQSSDALTECNDLAGDLDNFYGFTPDVRPNKNKQKINNKLAELTGWSYGSGDPLVGTMILVEGGSFAMGCTSEQSNCNRDESPAHSVTLSNFYIGQTEATQAQWRAVMGADPPGLNFKGCDDCPVERVSWDDVQEFLTKLNGRSGIAQYRLPTEAEWEYAARGGRQSKKYLYAGGNDLDAVAWYTGDSGRKMYPVKSNAANELGLYDMSGNVWEWCSDWKDIYSADNQTDPTGPSSGSYRALRGGSWASDPQYCRVAGRGYEAPNYRYNNTGFRLVRAK